MNENGFTFEYEQPNARKVGMAAPVKLYLSAKRTGGTLSISETFLNNEKVSGKQIAIQVKGEKDTYVIFNPPDNAPRFIARKSKVIKNTLTYSGSDVVRKILTIFNNTLTSPQLNDKAILHYMWLDFVGEFGFSRVYRLRNLNNSDTPYEY